jgi:signal transduction histidine kinase
VNDPCTNAFRRLYRLDKSRTTPGSGLGLSLIKAIAELHDATVALEDNKPGLTVIVQFSVSRTDAAASSCGSRPSSAPAIN